MTDKLDPPHVGAGPLTLDMADKLLHWLEGVATANRDSEYALRFVLINALRSLHKTGALDLNALIPRLHGEIHRLPPNTHWAVLALLEELADALHAEGGPPPKLRQNLH